jgi:hypothetical protein
MRETRSKGMDDMIFAPWDIIEQEADDEGDDDVVEI